MSEISRFHYITQGNILGYTHSQLAEEACMGGASWVQLRVKKKGYSEWKDIAADTQNICRKYLAKLIINDNVRIAKEIDADGVHIGKEDMLPKAARSLLGKEKIIGGTANSFIDIAILAEAGVDYIGLGPFRFTETKEKLSPVLGLEGYRQIIEACKKNGINIPIVAIGGIKKEDIKDLLNTGVYGIAVSSAVNNELDKEEAVKSFLKEIQKLVK
jgi:thiamine-phosphate pyrophosphorylase